MKLSIVNIKKHTITSAPFHTQNCWHPQYKRRFFLNLRTNDSFACLAWFTGLFFSIEYFAANSRKKQLNVLNVIIIKPVLKTSSKCCPCLANHALQYSQLYIIHFLSAELPTHFREAKL